MTIFFNDLIVQKWLWTKNLFWVLTTVSCYSANLYIMCVGLTVIVSFTFVHLQNLWGIFDIQGKLFYLQIDSFLPEPITLNCTDLQTFLKKAWVINLTKVTLSCRWELAPIFSPTITYSPEVILSNILIFWHLLVKPSFLTIFHPNVYVRK